MVRGIIKLGIFPTKYLSHFAAGIGFQLTNLLILSIVRIDNNCKGGSNNGGNRENASR